MPSTQFRRHSRLQKVLLPLWRYAYSDTVGGPWLRSPQVHAEKMRQALTMDVLATDLADYLVRKGVGGIYRFRGAH